MSSIQAEIEKLQRIIKQRDAEIKLLRLFKSQTERENRQQSADITALREAITMLIAQCSNCHECVADYVLDTEKSKEWAEFKRIIAATDPNRVIDHIADANKMVSPEAQEAWDALKVGEKYCDGEEKS